MSDPVPSNSTPPAGSAATETPDQILEATAAVIVREGMAGASLRSVAEEADVSLGLLSYHFDDKQTLIREAFKRATDILLERSLSAMEDPAVAGQPDRQVEAYIRGAFDDDFLDPEYLNLRISLWSTARTNAEIADVEFHLYQRYADTLSSVIALARPELAPEEIRQRATDVIVVQNGLWLNWARYRRREDVERGLRLCVSIALS
ncbi:MAG: TetR/AcrR family transcriptional regulator [Acidimicrobiia bacterium]|nr:TetR/AcrR family transcriptional regulator [Acidimicrobiia bacterium]